MLTRLAISCLALAVMTPAVSAGLFLPNFNNATFDPNQTIDNTYSPMAPGTIMTYKGWERTDEGEIERIRIVRSVKHTTTTIAGVTATILRDRNWVDGELVEDTYDWFAQDTRGNVWYLGEDSTEFEYDDDGNVIGTDTSGSWEAGVNGARAGWIMPATPRKGMKYYQEHAPADDALDKACVISLMRRVSVPAGNFTNVVDTIETSRFDPGVFESKQYAPGVGLVLIKEDTNRFGNNPSAKIRLVDIRVVPQGGAGGGLASLNIVPEPASAAMLLTGTLVMLRRRHRRKSA